MAKKDNTNFEQKLIKAADKLRKKINAAEYKNIVLYPNKVNYCTNQQQYFCIGMFSWKNREHRHVFLNLGLIYGL